MLEAFLGKQWQDEMTSWSLASCSAISQQGSHYGSSPGTCSSTWLPIKPQFVMFVYVKIKQTTLTWTNKVFSGVTHFNSEQSRVSCVLLWVKQVVGWFINCWIENYSITIILFEIPNSHFQFLQSKDLLLLQIFGLFFIVHRICLSFWTVGLKKRHPVLCKSVTSLFLFFFCIKTLNDYLGK